MRVLFLALLGSGVLVPLWTQIPPEWNLTEEVLNSGQSEAIRVETLPQGAEVVLDNQVRGASPWEIPLKPGQVHTLKIQKDFFNSKEIQITLPQGRRWILKPQLTQSFGEVRWKGLPPKSEIFLITYDRSLRTFGNSLKVPFGRHTAEVVSYGYQNQSFTWDQNQELVELDYQPRILEKGNFSVHGNFRKIPLDSPKLGSQFRLSLWTQGPELYFWEIYGPGDLSPRQQGQVKTQDWTTEIFPWAQTPPGPDWAPGTYTLKVYPQQQEARAKTQRVDLVRGQELGWTTGGSGVSGLSLVPGAGVRGPDSFGYESGIQAAWSGQGPQFIINAAVQSGLPGNLELTLGYGFILQNPGPELGFQLEAGLKQTWLGDTESWLALGPWIQTTGAWTVQGTALTLEPSGIPREGINGGLALRLGRSRDLSLHLSPGLQWGPRTPAWEIRGLWAAGLAFDTEEWGVQASAQGDLSLWKGGGSWEKASIGFHAAYFQQTYVGLNLGAQWTGAEVKWSLGIRHFAVF